VDLLTVLLYTLYTLINVRKSTMKFRGRESCNTLENNYRIKIKFEFSFRDK